MKGPVPAALDGQRLDRAIAALTDLSRSAVRELLDTGGVRYNGAACDEAALRVSSGHEIELDADRLAAVSTATQSNQPPKPAADVAFEVIHADEHIVVVNKPVGLVTHPGAGHQNDTLLNGLLHRFSDMSQAGPPERPGIIHRLDRDTSGLLVCARTQQAHENLGEQMAARRIEREYIAVVRGVPVANSGTIDAPIGRSHRNRKKMQIRPDQRVARTDYEVLGRSPCPQINPPQAALLRCRLQTGRTHQIRVHLASIKLPVLGDPVYGCPDPFGGNRQLLHAFRLSFEHPATQRSQSFSSSPPPDILAAVESLGLTAELNAALADPNPTASK